MHVYASTQCHPNAGEQTNERRHQKDLARGQRMTQVLQGRRFPGSEGVTEAPLKQQ